MLYLILAFIGALLFLIGACFFSFLNVVVWRTPRKESLVHGRSHCPVCGRVLTAWELVPCFSFLALRGKCYGCGAKIPVRDFWVEVLGGVLFLACNVHFGLMTGRALLSFALLFILTVVALMDWDTMEIYDRFHVMILGCAALSLWLFPEITLMERLIGCLCVSAPMFALAMIVPGGFGGGDIKLMFALGAYLGWKNTLLAAFFGVVSGGLYAVMLLRKKKAGRKDQFAFGPFLCTGAAAAIFFGQPILQWYLSLWQI
ncbi:MAG: prepilin peptidase [Oscillibacter sp.]|nr:prepilin peptidase [Oscillibacter sp.]